jgi:hypothetical protein
MVCFQTKKIPIWVNLEGLRLENVDIFLAILNILRKFGKFYDNLVHFFRFWYHVPTKIWQPWDAAITFSKQTIKKSVCGSPGMMRVEKVGGLVCRTSAGWA